MIPYQEITAAADRRWTSRLLTRLPTSDPADEELDALVRALCSLSDPRSFAPLEAVLLDDGRPARVREAAGFVLGSMDHVALEPEPGKVFHWWREGDDLLRKHALCCMDWVCCPEELLRVAADGTHALQAVALGRMAWGFDLPGREAVKIAALSHERAGVRSAAATVLLWDEPAACRANGRSAGRVPFGGQGVITLSTCAPGRHGALRDHLFGRAAEIRATPARGGVQRCWRFTG
jgi:hypothetical protein